MAVWYLAADNELLIDLDDYMRPSKSGVAWGEVFFRRRLRDAIRDQKLLVRDVRLERSTTDRHYHAVVRLMLPLPLMQRLVWQLHLGSDLYRGRADLMRAARGFEAPSLLILPAPIPNFYREPDRRCRCTEKHRTDEQHALGTQACQVWRELRGMSPWELFGQSSQERERGVKLPIGRVPMELILRKENH